jgi:hypothetical protein
MTYAPLSGMYRSRLRPASRSSQRRPIRRISPVRIDPYAQAQNPRRQAALIQPQRTPPDGICADIQCEPISHPTPIDFIRGRIRYSVRKPNLF